MNRSILVKVLLLVLYQLCRQIFCKECTNIPPLSSHTLRYELESSENQTLKQDMYSHYYHHHLTPTDDSAWSSLFPRKMLKEEEKDDGEQRWAMLYRNIKKGIVDNNGGGDSFLKEVSLHDVRLDPGSIFGQAQQTNLEYLLMLDVDSLVWSFRKTAGLSTPGEPYGGWEKPEMELRGHFVGHYLSASAQMWASTHNETLKQKMDALVSALSACQDKLQTGYLSAFPSEFFDRFEAVKPVWAPYYTIHKILAGLLDQYTLAGNDKALKMTVWMVDYFYGRVQNVIKKYSIERHWYSLNEETGGMNDVLYKLYSVTGDDKHLLLAHLFDKPCFLGLLAVKADDISGFHANTHIPVVVGSQMRYEVTGDPLYKEIGTFFMDIVNSSHSYATGGTSVNEFWTNPKRLADTLNTENEESCTTYNMLKVSRHLFRWTKEMAYADYYERALTNGVLTVQRGRDPGVMIYMLPLSHGSSKAHSYHGWGTKYDSFWCCYGTGIESFSKLGDSIYFEEGGKTPSLYIIQYISSSINWRAGNISLRQEVDPIVSLDQRFRVAFTFASTEQHSSGGTATLKFRIPLWTNSDGAKASINGQDLPLLNPGNFLSISKNWSPGDKIIFDLPLSIRTEAIKDDRPEYSSLKAIFYGPYLLAGLSDGEWEIDATSATSVSDWLTPIPPYYNSHLISLSQESGQSALAVTISNASLKMDYIPPPGNNSAVRSTFRIIPKEDPKQLKNFTNPKDAIGKLVVLEPFNSPGMAIAHNGEGGNLVVATEYSSAAVFRLVRGLDGGDSTVSLESNDRKGCFVYSGADSENGTTIKLRCKSTSVVGNDEDGFKKGASFSMGKGFSEYDPISFVAKGKQRNFLMSPLLSLRDESYTVYFNIHS
ncbi:hypothetical protein ABFS82_04G056000 [Erythranthe guttata]|uniref:uncharacterized protein LOC105950999 isoform X1 n=1 Tax=Erythranthe guttata TaxID=4155 RepID=UPI00064D76CC|nr:PREDICTED: uncharacterized protein LOC105950999 isoform X1 [Erythranthe guttata]|eukprot:XP_012829849.1 PREDICTED: uncharacterized protein LOC105950999 isoform X1 [Erythranthe guttata]